MVVKVAWMSPCHILLQLLASDFLIHALNVLKYWYQKAYYYNGWIKWLIFQDVDFDMNFDHENSFVGGPFEFKFQITNTSASLRTVSGAMVVKSVFQTGNKSVVIHREDVENLQLKAQESK